MTLQIELPAEQYEQLEQLARSRGQSAEEFARQELADRLSRDEAVRAASAYVLRKNAELYRRLAR